MRREPTPMGSRWTPKPHIASRTQRVALWTARGAEKGNLRVWVGGRHGVFFRMYVLLPHSEGSGFHTLCRGDGPGFRGLGERCLNPRIFQLSQGISLERGISTFRLLSFALATRSKLWGQNETNEGSQQEVHRWVFLADAKRSQLRTR